MRGAKACQRPETRTQVATALERAQLGRHVRTTTARDMDIRSQRQAFRALLHWLQRADEESDAGSAFESLQFSMQATGSRC